MYLPSVLADSVQTALKALKDDNSSELRPFYRASIYSALGNFDPELNYLFCGHVSILTAQKVIPLWKKVLLDAGVFDGEPLDDNQLRRRLNGLIEQYVELSEQSALWHSIDNIKLNKAQIRSSLLTFANKTDPNGLKAMLYILDEDPFFKDYSGPKNGNFDFNNLIRLTDIPNQDLPFYLLALTQAFLNRKVELKQVKIVLEEIYHWLGGSFLGFSDKEFPANAFYAGLACENSLHQVAHYNLFQTFWSKKVGTSTKNSDIRPSEADPAWCAFKAFAFEYNTDWVGQFSPSKSFEFWEWWLNEAIPQAWELAHQGVV